MTTTNSLRNRFHDIMVDSYARTGRETGYWANRWLQKVRRDGGVDAAKYFLKPSSDIPSGLRRLWELDRLDLSLEALVTKTPWDQFFTDAELQEARQRLARVSALPRS